MTTSAVKSSGRSLQKASVGTANLTGAQVRLRSILVGLLLPTVLVGCEPKVSPPQMEVQSFSGATMGTSYSVRIVVEKERDSESTDLAAIQKEVDQRLSEINSLMSTYDAESELSKFNQSTDDDWLPVSAETAHVVEYALKLAADSDGAFDPTVGPLVNLWGFGPAKRPERLPSEEEIEAAKSKVGFDKLAVRTEPPAMRKTQPDLYVDLSAIAKGYAVDEVSELLSDLGYDNSMVEIGGEVRTRGTKPGDELWRIGVEKPDSGGRSLQKVYPLRDAAMATSGDYRNYFELEGVRYSHTIDPAAGRPVQHQTATVTVLAGNCLEADALATALLVLGDGRGYDWCVERDIAALFLVREENRVVERASPRFEQMAASDKKTNPSEP